MTKEIRKCALCGLPMRNSWHSRSIPAIADGTPYLKDEYVHMHCEKIIKEEAGK